MELEAAPAPAAAAVVVVEASAAGGGTLRVASKVELSSEVFATQGAYKSTY